ncbi:MAG: response regulator [Chloroflexota bacterium]
MKKVLMADDDPAMMSLLKILLGMDGYEVSTLLDKTGDILENIRAVNPDFLLIDIYLGDRNGMDVVRQIRQIPDLNGIKIIMASGAAKAEECLAAGADAFLLKPYMPDELLDILRA